MANLKDDPRIDPRIKEMMDLMPPLELGDVVDREQLLAEANHPKALARAKVLPDERRLTHEEVEVGERVGLDGGRAREPVRSICPWVMRFTKSTPRLPCARRTASPATTSRCRASRTTFSTRSIDRQLPNLSPNVKNRAATPLFGSCPSTLWPALNWVLYRVTKPISL